MCSNKPTDMLRVETSDKKYTVIQDETGHLTALRYGEVWRDCVGDGLIFTLAVNLDNARADLAAAQKACVEKDEVMREFDYLMTSHLLGAEQIAKWKHALSLDCGRGFIPVKELEPTIQWFDVFLSSYNDHDIKALQDLHPGQAAGEVSVSDVLAAVKELARLEALKGRET